MMKETIIEMITSYFNVDESKFMSVANNIKGLNINSIEDIKNLDISQLQALLDSFKSAYGEVANNEELKTSISNLADKFTK